MEGLGILTVAAILLTVPMAASAADARDDSPGRQPDVCLAKSQLTNSLSPVDLWRSIGNCVMNDSYGEAVFQYALAGSFARFDTLRVADETAHQAASALPYTVFGSLSQTQLAKFRQRVQQDLGDDSRRKQACADVLGLGPPQYFPTYMVQHGMAAMRASGAGSPLVADFDASRAWPQAVAGYLQCP